jgi:hypothetical protein
VVEKRTTAECGVDEGYSDGGRPYFRLGLRRERVKCGLEAE